MTKANRRYQHFHGDETIQRRAGVARIVNSFGGDEPGVLDHGPVKFREIDADEFSIPGALSLRDSQFKVLTISPESSLSIPVELKAVAAK